MKPIINISATEILKKMRLDAFLATMCPDVSRTRLKSLIESGHVSIKGVPLADPSYKVKEGDSFQVEVPPPIDALPVPQDIPLSILYEDQDLLVIDKPAGLVVHPAPGNSHGTLVNALLAHCQNSLSGIGGVKRPGIVHRLDKETSGLMVIAKSDAAHKGLSLQFKDRTLSRRYKAFVIGTLIPLHGYIEKNIERSHKDRTKMTTVSNGGRIAKTEYKTLTKFQKSGSLKPIVSLIECKLYTGRTHQIRVHLASIGHPVVGDETYGHTPSKSPLGHLLHEMSWKPKRQALHAYSLDFIHPITLDAMHFESPLPVDMETLLENLNNFCKKD